MLRSVRVRIMIYICSRLFRRGISVDGIDARGPRTSVIIGGGGWEDRSAENSRSRSGGTR